MRQIWLKLFVLVSTILCLPTTAAIEPCSGQLDCGDDSYQSMFINKEHIDKRGSNNQGLTNGCVSAVNKPKTQKQNVNASNKQAYFAVLRQHVTHLQSKLTCTQAFNQLNSMQKVSYLKQGRVFNRIPSLSKLYYQKFCYRVNPQFSSVSQSWQSISDISAV